MRTNIKSHLHESLGLVGQADMAIMGYYKSGENTVEYKTDNSPLTKADLAAHSIIFNGLKKLFPDIPVISEEGDPTENKHHLSKAVFWLVDPLDGTQEFVNKQTGDFAVCLGLIEDGIPVFGIVSTPAHNQTYYGGPGMGSYKIVGGQSAQPINVAQNPVGVVMGSRLRSEAATTAYLQAHYPDHKIESFGSQLKFLKIAEGKADAYPRFNHTMGPWDLAAAQAIVVGAGGKIVRPDGSPLNYQNESLQIGDFIASSS